MRRLLRFEFRKLKKQKTLYILYGVSLGLALLISLLFKAVVGIDEEIFAELFSIGMLDGVHSVLSAPMWAEYFTVSAIVIAIYCTTDYRLRTIKNLYSRGFSRTRIFISKYIVAMTFSMAAAVGVMLFTFIIRSLMFGVGSMDAGQFTALLLAQLFATLAYNSMFFGIVMFIKNVGGAIAGVIVFPAVVTMVLQVVDMVYLANNNYVVEGVGGFTSRYWIEYFPTDLANPAITAGEIWIRVGLSVVYGSAFVFLAWWRNRKHEV